MKLHTALAVTGILIAFQAGAATNTASLVEVKSSDYGDTNCLMRVVELERSANTSRLNSG